MQKSPILVPQRPSGEIYELVKNRLLHTEFKGLPKEEINRRMERVHTAYRIAKQAHNGQTRDEGEDYFKDHILPVVKIYLDELRGEKLSGVLSAILHDTVEDREEMVDLYVIRKLFPEEVADNVDYLTKPPYSSYLPPAEKLIYDGLAEEEKEKFMKPWKPKIGPILSKEYFERMMKGASDTAVQDKVADRIHNLRTSGKNIHKTQKNIKETEKYILPLLAERNMSREIELLTRELVRLKIHLQNVSNQESLKETLESQPE